MNRPAWRPGGHTPRAIILSRVSTSEQAKNTSHDSQIEGCERYCNYEGFDVVLKLQETVSGALYNAREETQRALELLENDSADVLVVYDMTRYGRDVEFQQKILKRIVRAGKRLQFATFPLEYDEYTGELTPEYEQIFNTLGGGSSMERAMIKRRMRNGKLRKVNNGIQVSRARQPFGFHIVKKADIIRGEFESGDEGKYFVIEEQAKQVRAIFEQYERLQSIDGLRRWLHERGIKSPSGKAYWSKNGIRYILTNTAYIGRPTWGRHRYQVNEEREARGLSREYWVETDRSRWLFLEAPAIVPEPLFHRVQALLETGRAKRSGRADRKFVLSGLLRCPQCGSSMACERVWDKNNKIHFRCNKRHRIGNEHPCDAPSIKDGAQIESAVIDAVIQYATQPESLKIIRAHRARKQPTVKAEKPAISQLRAELEALEKRERAAAESRIEAKVAGQNVDVYDRILREITARRNEIRALIEQETAPRRKSPEPIAHYSDSEAALIESVLRGDATSPDEKNKVLRQLVESVVPAPKELRICLKNPRGESGLVLVKTRGGLALRVQNEV